jgi:hypothetical protein
MKHNWTILYEFDKQLKTRLRKSFRLKCECGQERDIYKSEWKRFLEGKSKSNLNLQCKNCSVNKYWDNFDVEKCYTNIINNIKSSAKRRKISFNLTAFKAKKMLQSNCHYCGAAPSNNYILPTNFNFQIKYSGIDRIDSLKGYEEENVVPCCIRCNVAKNNMDCDEFLKLVENIYSNCVQRLSREGVHSSEWK